MWLIFYQCSLLTPRDTRATRPENRVFLHAFEFLQGLNASFFQTLSCLNLRVLLSRFTLTVHFSSKRLNIHLTASCSSLELKSCRNSLLFLHGWTHPSSLLNLDQNILFTTDFCNRYLVQLFSYFVSDQFDAMTDPAGAPTSATRFRISDGDWVCSDSQWVIFTFSPRFSNLLCTK